MLTPTAISPRMIFLKIHKPNQTRPIRNATLPITKPLSTVIPQFEPQISYRNQTIFYKIKSRQSDIISGSKEKIEIRYFEGNCHQPR